jgi:toluene monooxygenase electron transfer component
MQSCRLSTVTVVSEADTCRPSGTTRRYRVTIATTGEAFEVAHGERVLGAARRAGIWLPFECGWGSCGTCKATLVEGQLDLLFAGCPALTPSDARRHRVLTCQSTPISDVIIKPSSVGRSPHPARPTADHTARLVDIERLGPEIARFSFDLSREANYLEGQHAVLELGDGLRRCYSMAGVAGTTAIQFIAKRYAGRAGSERLFGVARDSCLPVELPYGDMWLRDGDRAAVLIAGGTGISAILPMVRKLATAGDRRPVRVFYGAGSLPELVCWDELLGLTEVLPDGEAQAAVISTESGWTGSVGVVTDLLQAQPEVLDDADIYLAGPPPMVDATLVLLRSLDIQLDRIHYDRFG